MRSILFITFVLLTSMSFGQKKVKYPPLKLTNALVIGQMDTPDDRYSIEISMTDLFARNGVRASPSLNVLKLGNDAQLLASDSLQKIVAAKGIDTYALITIRGFDRKYQPSNVNDDFETALGQASFFGLYREGAVSVSVQFKFFRDGKCVYAEVIKVGNIGSRESVIKRLSKKVNKRLAKKWKK